MNTLTTLVLVSAAGAFAAFVAGFAATASTFIALGIIAVAIADYARHAA